MNLRSIGQLKNQVFLVIAMFLASCAAIGAEPELNAQESVDFYISALLARVKEVQPLYETQPTEYFNEIEQALSAFVDFKEVARGVMAKYGTGQNGASVDQLNRFSEVFKLSLVDFYGSALASYSGGEFEFLESRRAPKNPEKATNVRMSIQGEDGANLEVQYTMFLDDARMWKLKNLYVEGINLRRQYFSRFDSLMKSNNFNIDTVIDSWKIED